MKTSLDTLVDLVARLESFGDAPAILAFTADGRESVSYRELSRRSRSLAAGLGERGLRPGQRVALFAPNSIDWIVCRLALVLAEAVCVPVEPDADAERLRRLLDDSGAGWLFAEARFLPTVREALTDLGSEVQVARIGEGDDGNDLATLSLDGLVQSPLRDLPAPDPEAVATRFYTSGTTGPPKAVPITHRNLAAALQTLLALDLVGSDDRILLPLPLHHSYPFIVGLLVPLAAGSTVVLPAGISGAPLRQALREGGVTTLVAVPRLYETLVAAIDRQIGGMAFPAGAALRLLLRISLTVRRRLGRRVGRTLLAPLHRRLAPDLRVMVSAGARLEPETEWRLEGLGWQVLTGYGLVETTSTAALNPPGQARVGSAGRAPAAAELRIAPVEEFAHGEVQVRGPVVFDGYPGNPEATADAFTKDGWFRTGDLGWLDEDGYLHIVGRRKEMIVLPDGKNVVPEDVEAVYVESEAADEVAVLERGGRLVGLVTPAAGQDARQVDDRLRVDFAERERRLPSHMRLADFVLTREPLPKNQLGKFKRHALAEIYDRAERGEPPPPRPLSPADEERLARPRARRLVELLQARLPDREIHPDMSLHRDLGIDSLAWVELGLELEREVGVALPEEAIADVSSVRDLLDAVEQAPAVGAGAERRAAVQDADRWLAEPGPAGFLAGLALLGLTRGLARGFFRLRTEGGERVPADGPLIIVANHQSDLDPIVLAAALPYRTLRRTWWGAQGRRVFGHWLGRALARPAHLFPVDERAPGASLEVAGEVLQRGRTLVWFPEEWRSPTGALQAFRPGIGALVERSGATVLPVHIAGTFEAMPRTARLPRPRPVRIRFGQPLPADALRPDPASEDAGARHRAIAERVREAVGALRDAVP